MEVEPVSSQWLQKIIKGCPVSGLVIDTEARDNGIAVILYESNWNKFTLDDQIAISSWLGYEIAKARVDGLPVFIDIEEVAPKLHG